MYDKNELYCGNCLFYKSYDFTGYGWCRFLGALKEFRLLGYLCHESGVSTNVYCRYGTRELFKDLK